MRMTNYSLVNNKININVSNLTYNNPEILNMELASIFNIHKTHDGFPMFLDSIRKQINVLNHNYKHGCTIDYVSNWARKSTILGFFTGLIYIDGVTNIAYMLHNGELFNVKRTTVGSNDINKVRFVAMMGVAFYYYCKALSKSFKGTKLKNPYHVSEILIDEYERQYYSINETAIKNVEKNTV